MVNFDPSSIGQQIGQEALQQTQHIQPADSNSVDAFNQALQGTQQLEGMQPPGEVLPGPAQIGGLHQAEQPSMLADGAQWLNRAAEQYNRARTGVVDSIQNQGDVSDIRSLMRTQFRMNEFGIMTQLTTAVAKQVQSGLKTLLQNQ